jgi:hypothetical protein
MTFFDIARVLIEWTGKGTARTPRFFAGILTAYPCGAHHSTLTPPACGKRILAPRNFAPSTEICVPAGTEKPRILCKLAVTGYPRLHVSAHRLASTRLPSTIKRPSA